MKVNSKFKIQNSKFLPTIHYSPRPAILHSRMRTAWHCIFTIHFKKGQILIIAIIFLVVVLMLAAVLFAQTTSFINFGANSATAEQATGLSEAGIEKALWQLNITAGAYSGETNTPLGTTGTFTVTVTNKTASLKTVTATGYVPNTQNPHTKRTVKVDTVVATTMIAFRYAVQTGDGGVDMANSATVNGTVYSNGNIAGSGSSTIDGDAFAVGTISSPNPFVTGSKHPGSPPSEMPTIDYQYWRDQAATGGTITCNPTCPINTDTHIGPKKYLGNLLISNQAKVTVDGPIYVTGNLVVRNGGTQVNLSENFGSNGTVFIVDGTVTVEQGGAFNPTNANPKGYILVVTTSTNPAAMSVENSGVNAVFYALDGGAQLSQSATVTALVAKSLAMSQSATLNYDSGLASTQFSQGPGGSWQIKKGTYRFTASP